LPHKFIRDPVIPKSVTALHPDEFTTWTAFWKNKKFRLLFIISVTGLALCAIIAPSLFTYIQERNGKVLQDVLLNALPAFDLSLWIFSILYIFILLGIGYLLTLPEQLLLGLQVFFWVTVFRFTCLFLIPLHAPDGLVKLDDPFLAHLFYRGTIITNDLFFSGHTSIVCVFAFVIQKPVLRFITVAVTAFIGVMLLIQHIHYTIDVLAAPVFTWLSFKLSQAILKRFGNSDI
jgi:hypothetical protein